MSHFIQEVPWNSKYRKLFINQKEFFKMQESAKTDLSSVSIK